MTKFQVRVPVSELAGWRVLAAREGVGVSELVRRRMGGVPAVSSGIPSGVEVRGEGVARESNVRVFNTPTVGNPVVAGLAASVPGVTVGVDHKARREAGLFDDGCLRSAAHRGGTPCGLCGGSGWA